MDIVVLAGGLSPERDVSLSSGCLIANALAGGGHRALLADLYGCAPAGGFDAAYARRRETQYMAPDGAYRYQVPPREPDIGALVAANGGRSGHVGPGVYELCASADATFLGLHGSVGENGQLQAAFDLHGIRYTGTGYAGSLLAMDKAISKELFRHHGIDTADWRAADFPARASANEDSLAEQAGSPHGGADPAADFVERATRSIGFPCMLKPNGCGSSVGVSLARNPAELESALELALRYSRSVIVERYIAGREFSVGVLGGAALPPIEIIPKVGFYDYRNKYQHGLAEEVCPARVPDAFSRRLQDAALAAHRALRLGSYSRVDFIAEADLSRAYCLEANTLPGMTPTSLLPQMALAAGISYRELCERIVSLSLGAEPGRS